MRGAVYSEIMGPCFFPPESRMNCPNVDVLTWTFENLGKYDQDKPLYVDVGDPTRSLSAREILVLVRRLVSGFGKFGLESGDCVCIHLFNELAYPITWLGAIGAGGCISSSNPSYNSIELKHHLKISNAKFVITQPDLLGIVSDAVQENNIPRSKVVILTRQGEHVPDGYASWEELLHHGESNWVRFDDEQSAQNTAAAVSSTSGTTGLPKGALLSHQNLVAQNIVITSQGVKPYEVSYLLAIPIFHGFAGGLAHITPLRTGHTVYLMRRFEMQPFLDAIYRFNITEATVVPPILTQILSSSMNNKPLLRSLRYIFCAGAALDPKIQLKMYDMLSPGAIVGQVWGLTELGWITQFQWPERDDTGSVGRQGLSQEIKLVDEYLQPITQPNREGEACVRGPNLFKGYLGDPSFNEEAFTHDGWFKTGDLMLCNEGKWYITGRRKDIFKVRGRQVSPNELESVLLGHPQIADVAIVGVPALSPATGDAPRAYVIRKSARTSQNDSTLLLSEADVKEWIVQRLARYKALDGGVEFVESIPRTASGKILRRLLRIKEQVAG